MGPRSFRPHSRLQISSSGHEQLTTPLDIIRSRLRRVGMLVERQHFGREFEPAMQGIAARRASMQTALGHVGRASTAGSHSARRNRFFTYRTRATISSTSSRCQSTILSDRSPTVLIAPTDSPSIRMVTSTSLTYYANTVTVYKHGQITPSLTLTEPEKYGPDDVAIAKNGRVLVGDTSGGVEVYPPGATSPSARLTNPALVWVLGVTVDASNNVYAAAASFTKPGVVIKFAKMTGSGTNLGLQGLKKPGEVLLDMHGDLVVSDIDENLIDIYPPGQTSPSSTILVNEPDRFAFNTEKDQIYVPQGGDALVSVFTYPAVAPQMDRDRQRYHGSGVLSSAETLTP